MWWILIHLIMFIQTHHFSGLILWANAMLLWSEDSIPLPATFGPAVSNLASLPLAEALMRHCSEGKQMMS